MDVCFSVTRPDAILAVVIQATGASNFGVKTKSGFIQSSDVKGIEFGQVWLQPGRNIA